MKHMCKAIVSLVLVIAILSSFALPVHAEELKTGIGIVTASCLRLRSEPSTDSEIIGKAYYGDSVVIIKDLGDWYLVNCNLETGYMYKDYIHFKERENVKLGYARFDYVTNIRSGPGTDNSIIDQARKGETCFIIGFNCEWFKVTYDGQTGYVRSDLVTLLEMPYSNYGSKGNTYRTDSSSSSSVSSASTSSSASSSASSSSSSASTSSSSSSASASSSSSSASASNSSSSSSASNSSSSSNASNSSSSASASNSSSSASTSSSSASSASTGSSIGQQMVDYAMQFLGYRYVWGGSSPSTGFDCSGLTSYVAKHFGYSIGRSAAAQITAGSYVSLGNLQPGDIVLFNRTYASSAAATHAGIYIGNHKFIHAANSRTGVVIGDLTTSYYASRFVCGRRLG